MGMSQDQALPRAALVTGAARRIGREIAVALADDGWAVAVHYNASAADAQAVVAEITRNGGRAAALRASLDDEAAVSELVPSAAHALGPLGLLVNNAARFERDEALTVTRESWDRHLEPNLWAPFVLMQQFARQLPEDARGVRCQHAGSAGAEPDAALRLLTPSPRPRYGPLRSPWPWRWRRASASSASGSVRR